ncbi:MAG: DEAD/DEAH box helicase [Phaeodactylibacter sp.]|uniref:DEAD/DEAH box helicase n=1 Tax=Phaeodactylibacter sp. TaxID=1940289 RepID=UPI0032ED35EE
MTFQDLGIIDPILKALRAQGYEQPTPIQQQAIPKLLKGKDLLGCAQTGTGKTAAFSIPILQQMHLDQDWDRRRREIKCLIVAPTRELAIQIDESISAYGQFLDLRNTVIFGGVKQGAQTRALKKGIDILTATPGRLLDLMGQGYISLKHVQFAVLDEADHMLDMGFIHDIKKVVKQLPAKRQSLFFSATMSPEILKLSSGILGHPERITIKPEQATADRVEQNVYFVTKNDKRKLLVHLLKENEVDSALVFSRTKHGANRIAKQLDKAGFNAAAIHGNKSQGARQKSLQQFKDGSLKVLVATDIAARGIDVDELSYVVNFDLPNVPETYVHRIGRTGRADASGIALSFCDTEERAYLKDIQKLIGQQIPVVKEHPFPDDGTTEAPREQSRQRSGNGGNNRNSRNNNNRRRRS